MLSREKKNPKCQHFQMENNLRWALYKVSGALQHKVYLGRGEGSECSGAVVRRCLIGWGEKREQTHYWKWGQTNRSDTKTQCWLDDGKSKYSLTHVFY